MRRKQVSGQAEAEYAADVALAAQFDDLLAAARAAEQAFRNAQSRAVPISELHPLAKRLDTVLTDVMRAAYAAQRAEIGPRGYEDRIYRRKAMAKSAHRHAAGSTHRSPVQRGGPVRVRLTRSGRRRRVAFLRYQAWYTL